MKQEFLVAMLEARDFSHVRFTNGHYKESIKIYDRFEAEVMMMAEMMYEGILKQFPHKFCK